MKTPKITWLKEIVTAGLGILIILATLWLLWAPLTKETADIPTAQAIFSILGGWGGVVLGYYFGRLPAERAATRAEVIASTAEMDKEAAVVSKKTSLTEVKGDYAAIEEQLEAYKKLISSLMKKIDEL